MSNTIYSSQIKVNCPLVHDESGYFHLVYQITNLVNGKVYVGKHTTKDPYDNYMGSGKLINRAIEKYGIENFTKEILYCFINEKEAYLKEEEIVTQEFIDKESTYNIKQGGNGFSSEDMIGEKNPMYGKKHSQEAKAKMSEQHWNCSGEKNPMYGKKHSQETKEKMTKAKMGKKSSFYGKHHKQESKEKISKAKQGKPRSQETKVKISKARKGKYTGENSPNYRKHHTQETRSKMSKNSACAKVVLKLDESRNIIAEYGCMKKCCQQECICRSTLKRLINNHVLHKGFYFEYKSKN